MAETNFTKRALAAALKELMKDIPFHKITISDICDQCDMSRKSFYYHFRDKYDLINWIFESEYISPLEEQLAHYQPANENEMSAIDIRWALVEHLCQYFHENKGFYGKVFQIRGQNCFTDYFKDLLRPLMVAKFNALPYDQRVIEFSTEFYMDSSLSALERWIVEKNAVPPTEFVRLLRTCIKVLYDAADIK